MIAVTCGARLQPTWIRAVPVLCERKTTDAFPRYQPRQPARMLFRRAKRMDCLDRKRALHRRQRAQTRISAFELLHDEPVRGVAHARASMLVQIRSVKAQRTHARDQMLRKFPRAMTRNDFGQNFLLHKTARPIARRALFICQKPFDAVVIERSYVGGSRGHSRQFNDRTTQTQRSCCLASAAWDR